MNTIDLTHIAVVVLAAGRGTRLECGEIPKVLCEIGGKPIVSYTVETLKKMGFLKEQICLVVGYGKEQVMEYFDGQVSFAVQEELKGTAHAAYTGIQILPEHIEQVLVLGGDDSAFYTVQSLQTFVTEHVQNNMTLSLLSVQVENPGGLGRVVRHENGDIEVIEKEYITREQEKIQEVSTGTFVFDRQWFQNIFPDMPELRKLGEYGLPTAIAMVRKAHLPYQVSKLEQADEWFGINTKDQLAEADRRKNNE